MCLTFQEIVFFLLLYYIKIKYFDNNHMCLTFQEIFFMLVLKALKCYDDGKTWELGEVNKC